MKSYKSLITILVIIFVLSGGLILVIYLKQDSQESVETEKNKNKIKPQVAEIEGKPRLVVQTGHTDEINTIALSSNGKLLATGSDEYDGSVKLWNIEKDLELRTFVGRKDFIADNVYTLDFSPDDKILASGSDDSYIRFWDVKTGQLLRIIEAHEVDRVLSIDFSPNGKLLASIGFSDATLKIWDVKTGKIVHKIKNQTEVSPKNESDSISEKEIVRDDFTSVSFSPSGNIVATSSEERFISAGEKTVAEIKIWNPINGQLFQTINAHTDKIRKIVFSPSGKLLGSCSADNKIKIWNPDNGELINTIEAYEKGVGYIAFSPDEKMLVSSSYNAPIKLWDVETGRLIKSFQIENTDSNVFPLFFLPDGKTVVGGGLDKTVKFYNMQNEKVSKFYKGKSLIKSFLFSPNESYLLTESEKIDPNLSKEESGATLIKLWNLEKGIITQIFDKHKKGVYESKFSPDSTILATIGFDNTIKLWNSETGELLHSFSIDFELKSYHQLPITFSLDGKTFAGKSDKNTVKIWNTENGEVVNTIPIKSSATSLSFSPDGKTLAISINDNSEQRFYIELWDIDNSQLKQIFDKYINWVDSVEISLDGTSLLSYEGTTYSAKIWDLTTGDLVKELDSKSQEEKLLKQFPYFFRNIFLIDISNRQRITKDNQFYIRKGETGKLELIDANSNKLLANLVEIDEKDWAVVTPDGRFDTSKLDNPQGLHWILPDAPFDPLSFEVFMRQYYEPKLLPRLMNCTRENNCDEEFKPVPSLTKLNRTQPEVKITDIKEVENDTIEVTVEVASVKSETQKDVNGNAVESGVFDVRLFRNGQLVGYAPQNNGEVELDANGKANLKFPNIKKPKTGISELEFSAYAFNYDQVKSQTYRKTFTITPKQEKGRAYIISLGVNAYELEKLNLRYAANDARQNQENLTKRLESQNQFKEVINIPLISDFSVTTKNGETISAQDATLQQLREGSIKITENNATKKHFKAIIDILAGREKNKNLLEEIPNSDKLRQANPEDLIILTVSSHGFTDREGIFYIVPSDSGTASVSSKEFRNNSISSDELSLWLRDIDGGEITLIVDACYSASAVENSEFKPAPMNSRGLGQLSYDKGMRILTATQADNVALETNKVRQGLLSYALLQDGLNDWKADYKPKDETILMSEWLNYGVNRVPNLYEEMRSGNLAKNTRAIRETVDTENNGSKRIKTQQPSLFNFSRQQDIVIMKR